MTSRTKEDNQQEEVESTTKKKNNDTARPPLGYICVPGTEEVVSEKTETRSKTREAKQEQLQYHDEGLRELTGNYARNAIIHGLSRLRFALAV